MCSYNNEVVSSPQARKEGSKGVQHRVHYSRYELKVKETPNGLTKGCEINGEASTLKRVRRFLGYLQA